MIFFEIDKDFLLINKNKSKSKTRLNWTVSLFVDIATISLKSLNWNQHFMHFV
jgi:hypothetical protein